MVTTNTLVAFAGDNAAIPIQPETWVTSSGIAFDTENQAAYAEQIYFLLADWQSGRIAETFPDITFGDVQAAIAEILAEAYANP